MIKDKNQKGGDHSKNLQANTININQGISYQDAKQIALDVFKANFLELSQSAAELTLKRAEEFIENFLETLKEKNPEAISNFNDPSTQYSLFSAQKSYAKTGDGKLMEVLIDILVDISVEKERTLKKIVLEESLSTAPKLTLNQLDILSLVFMITEISFDSINSFESFDALLVKYVKPLSEDLHSANSLYLHLAYTGCCNLRQLVFEREKIEDYFKETYRGLFQVGFTKDEFLKRIGDESVIEILTTQCLHDPVKLQIPALNERHLENIFEEKKINPEILESVKSLFKSNTMKNEDVRRFLVERNDWIEKLLKQWENSSLQVMTLTSVGIAIAQANLKRKTGLGTELGKWIRERD